MIPVLLLISHQAVQAPEFDTTEEAAVAALHASYVLTPFYEIGGVIVKKPNGKYEAELPHTEYVGDAVSLDQDPANYNPTYQIAATFHTHPCLKQTHIPAQFSPEDLSIARTGSHVAYIADFCTGKVHKYDPIKDVLPLEAKRKGFEGPVTGEFSVSGDTLDDGTKYLR